MFPLIEWLIEPFQYAFIQRAMLSAVLVGLLCAGLGVFVVLRRMSLIGHALSHSALPGLVIAYLIGANIFLGALVATLVTALAIGILSKNKDVYEDTSIGMMPTIMFAIGILLISTSKSYRDLSGMLFGNILGVTNHDLMLIGGICCVVFGGMALFFKELKLFCVDPNYAKSIGLPVNLVRYGLLVALSLTVVVGIQAVGTILTNALLVIPVAAARLLTDRLNIMLILACVFASIAGLCGVYASYYFGFSSGAAIVLVCALFFIMAWGCKVLSRSS